MTETKSDALAVEVSRVLPASCQRVFDAWRNPAMLEKWWHKSEKYVCSFAEVDFREGGSYRLGMRFVEKAEPYVCYGEYREIEEPTKIVFTWNWEKTMEGVDSIVTITLKELGPEETELTLRHEQLPDNEAGKQHKEGWTDVLNTLAGVLASE
jgi:uncharacterized protein YndB with AHSA1/START domain